MYESISTYKLSAGLGKLYPGPSIQPYQQYKYIYNPFSMCSQLC